MDINFDNLDSYHRTLDSSFFGALAAAPPVEWSKVAMRIPSSSSRNEYPFLGEVDSMRRFYGERIVRQLQSHKFAITNEEFELTMAAKRTELEDDAGGNIALYSTRAQIMARSVARQPDELVMGELLPAGTSTPCYDGQNFFDDHTHGIRSVNADGSFTVTATTVSNDMAGSGTPWYLFDMSKPVAPIIFQERLAPEFSMLTDINESHVFRHSEFMWGARRRNAAGFGMWQQAVRSAQTLDRTNLEAAMLRMTSFNNDEGVRLKAKATILVVPQSLEFVARDLLSFPLNTSDGGQNRAYGLIPYFVSQYL